MESLCFKITRVCIFHWVSTQKGARIWHTCCLRLRAMYIMSATLLEIWSEIDVLEPIPFPPWGPSCF